MYDTSQPRMFVSSASFSVMGRPSFHFDTSSKNACSAGKTLGWTRIRWKLTPFLHNEFLLYCC